MMVFCSYKNQGENYLNTIFSSLKGNKKANPLSIVLVTPLARLVHVLKKT